MNIDIIRIFAFIFIVMLHTLNRQYGLNVWMGGYAVISIGVNLFIMISGYLLLDRDEAVIDFLKKRLFGILPLFIVFNVLYIYFYRLPIVPVLKGKSFSAPHFWYIYMIFGLYMLTPWLRKVLYHSEKETALVVFFWFLANILNPYLRYFNLAEIPFSHFPITGFLGYYLLGYYYKKYNNKLKKLSFLAIIPVYLIGFSISVLSTRYILITTGKRVSDFFDKNSLGPFLMTVAFFAFWIKYEFKERNRIVRIISEATYFAFLIHLAVLDYVIRISDEMIFKSVATVIVSLLVGIAYNYAKGYLKVLACSLKIR